MSRTAFPYRNSWFQLAALTLTVSVIFLAVDFTPEAAVTWTSGPHRKGPGTQAKALPGNAGAPQPEVPQLTMGWTPPPLDGIDLPR